MKKLTLRRGPYWLWIAIVFVLKLAAITAIMTYPNERWIPKYVDMPLALCFIIAVMARLRDAGRPIWLGAVPLFFFMFVLPFVLGFAAGPSKAQLALDAFAAVDWLWLSPVGTFTVIIIVGLLRSRSLSPGTSNWAEFSDPTAAPERQRIEPRF
jgi:uncharacterized membrane protein YhaH (DUF805 family)